MLTWKTLWGDEQGAVVTAELVTLGTVGVLSGLVGLNVAAKSVNEELTDVANSFRSLDQSFCYEGFKSCNARVPGSSYRQEDIEDSLAELSAFEEELKREEAEHRRGERRRRTDDHRESDRAKPRLVPKKKRPESRRKPTSTERTDQVRVRIPIRNHV